MYNLFAVFNGVVWGVVLLVLIYKFVRSIRLVPTKEALIVERLGKYHTTLGAGFHTMIPFIDRVAFTQDLKEETIDVPPQECFTNDNVKVEVDGVAYISVVDPVKASYGITDYREGAIQLAQTTTRSIIGTLDLDKTFEERDAISSKVVSVLNEAGELWGIKIHRFEIKNIAPPASVRDSMEKQVNAERERRAIVAKSEGDKQSRINRSEGLKMELINRSEGEMQRRINIAEGRAAEIESIAEATAGSITKLAEAIHADGGDKAVNLQLSQKLIDQLGRLASKDSKIVLPANLMNMEELMDNLGLKSSS